MHQLIPCVVLIETWKVCLVSGLMGTFWPIESIHSFFLHIFQISEFRTPTNRATFCLRCCYWILTTELDCNLHAVNYWAKMKSTTALKSGLAVVSALEGVVIIAVNLYSLMRFLFSVFSFNSDNFDFKIFLITVHIWDFHCNFKKIVSSKPKCPLAYFCIIIMSFTCFIYNLL